MIATIARQVLMLWSATHQHDWSLEKKLGFDSQIWYDAWPTKCCASIIPCHGVVKLEPMILYGYQVPFADSQISWIRNHSKTNGTITEHLSQESCNPSLLSWCKRLRDRGSVLEKMGIHGNPLPSRQETLAFSRTPRPKWGYRVLPRFASLRLT